MVAQGVCEHQTNDVRSGLCKCDFDRRAPLVGRLDMRKYRPGSLQTRRPKAEERCRGGLTARLAGIVVSAPHRKHLRMWRSLPPQHHLCWISRHTLVEDQSDVVLVANQTAPPDQRDPSRAKRRTRCSRMKNTEGHGVRGSKSIIGTRPPNVIGHRHYIVRLEK